MRKIAIVAERYIPQEEIAHGVGAIFSNQLYRINRVTKGFTNLLTVDSEEAVGKDLFGQFFPDRFQQRGPNDTMEFQNIFTNNMDIGWPIAFEFLFVLAVADCRAIIKQFVEPNIDGLLLVPGQWKSKFGSATGDRNVFQALINQ